MPGSRSVALLALASVLIMMLASAAWCGGPVTGAPRAGYQPTSPFISRGGETGPAEGGGFSIAGSLGSGTVNGSNGKSPWVEFSDLGFKSDIVWGARARFEPKMFGLGLGINGDVLYTELTGHESSYSGDYTDGFIFTQGSSLESKLNLTIVSVTADIGLAGSTLGWRGIALGPRVGWTQYIDRFRVQNNTLGHSDSSNRSIAMFTAGVAGRECLKTLAGLGNLPGPAKAFEPVVSGSWMIGDAKSMRYYNWEAFVGIFTTSLAGAFDGFPAALPISVPVQPSIGVELGWVHYEFYQKNAEEELHFGVWSRDSNARYRIDIPTVRAVVAF